MRISKGDRRGGQTKFEQERARALAKKQRRHSTPEGSKSEAPSSASRDGGRGR